MATSLFKSLQCKSTAFDDVAYAPKPKSKCKSNSNSNSKPLLPSAASCGSSSQALRDVIFLFPKHPHPLPKKPPENNHKPNPSPNHPPPPPKPKSKHKSRPPKNQNQKKPAAIPSSPVAAVAAAGPTSFPTLTELPAGHSSRRVVEIIFGSSWSPAPFPGRIEMLFRVHNPARTVARFEEYRSAVRLLSGCGDARCAADGNEMMRFHCGGDAADGIYDAGVVWSAGERGIRTFAGSGGAHESGGGGGGPGRRAMLVCRVIAGRVRRGSAPDVGGESVCREKHTTFILNKDITNVS